MNKKTMKENNYLVDKKGIVVSIILACILHLFLIKVYFFVKILYYII